MTRQGLILLAAAMVLGGCSLSARKVAEVDHIVTEHQVRDVACTETILRCAIPSPLLEQAEADIGNGQQRVTLVEHGEAALALRVHLVRAAQDYVDVQNFILRKDETGELLLNELLGAARRGVRVRLLLDQMFSFSDAEYLVRLTLSHRNLEVRFYNPTFYKAKMAKHDWLTGIACCFRNVNQRMHNKLQVVDDAVGVVGGRNIADRYFDYDTNYLFKDRDVAVFGPAARGELVDATDPGTRGQAFGYFSAFMNGGFVLGPAIGAFGTSIFGGYTFPFVFMGLLAGTPEGYGAGMFYVIVYSLMSAAAFGMVILLSGHGIEAEKLEDFKGLNQRNPWYAAIMAMVMFSMAGVPVFVGFFAKWLVIQAALNAGLVWLAIVAVVFSVVGAFYYIRVVKLMYFDEPVSDAAIEAPVDFRAAISLNGVMMLGLGIFSGSLIAICMSSFGA